MNSVTKEDLIGHLRRVTRENDGRPLGERRFYRETKLTLHSLWDAGIRNYGDLCELAGLPRNRLQQRMRSDQLFDPLAVLAAKLKRFPDQTDRAMAHRHDAAFPSYEAYRTVQDEKGPLEHQLLDWCRSRPEHSAAAGIMQSYVSQQGGPPTTDSARPANRKRLCLSD